jgi:L-asparaginase
LSPEHWRTIAELILEEYDANDGFVIVQGIDTLSYTASALSFVFENLGKPIVVTPRQELDQALVVHDNLLHAILVAAYLCNKLPLIPEVVVISQDLILRGNRTRVLSNGGYRSIDSPNCPPLGTIGDTITINSEMIRPVPESHKHCSLNNSDWKQIGHLLYYPGCSSEFICRFLAAPELKGLILEVYGAGNVPVEDDALNAFQEFSNSGKAVVLIERQVRSTQAIYESTARLQKAGVIVGSDLTTESALAKLSLTLGRELSLSDVRKLFKYDLRGEQSHSEGHVEDLWLPINDASATIIVANQINHELLRYFARHPQQLHSLTPRNFEVLVAEIFKHHGYEVTLTPATRDGGYDFRALFVDGLGIKCLSLVEAKHFAPDQPVGIAIVRSLYGVVSSINAERGIIVTTSRFTKDAKQFQSAVMNRIALHDYNDLSQWLLTL